jgi:hypothetical protein
MSGGDIRGALPHVASLARATGVSAKTTRGPAGPLAECCAVRFYRLPGWPPELLPLPIPPLLPLAPPDWPPPWPGVPAPGCRAPALDWPWLPWLDWPDEVPVVVRPDDVDDAPVVVRELRSPLTLTFEPPERLCTTERELRAPLIVTPG